MPRVSDRSHWDRFWTRERSLDEIYDNDDRICEELSEMTAVQGELVLEVGAATARDSISLAGIGADAVALDYSHEALRLAGEASRSEGRCIMLVCGDAEALPFRDGTLDLVFHQGVMEHFRNPGRMLSVSHYRMPLIKKIVPLELLVRMDSVAQLTGDWWQLTPSVFVASETPAGGLPAEPGSFFACPECQSALGEANEGLLTCPDQQCGRSWRYEDGLYDFKEPL